MRLVTGSVLAVLVGGVAYMNFFAADRGDVAPTDASSGAVGEGSARQAAPQGAPAPGHAGGGAAPGGATDDEAARRGSGRDGGERSPSAGEVLADLVGGEQGESPGPAATARPERVDVRVAVKGDDGSALAGVDVFVVPQGTEAELARATTGRAGAAELGDLEPGLYQLRLDPTSIPEGYAAPWQPALCRGGSFPAGIGSPCFAVLGDGRATDVAFEVVRPAELVGRVFGVDGAPAEDAIARVVAVGTGLETCRAAAPADADGKFRFELVPARYRLEVSFGPDGPNAGAARFPATEVQLEAGVQHEVPDLVPAGVARAVDVDDDEEGGGEGGLDIRLADGEGEAGDAAADSSGGSDPQDPATPPDGATVELNGRALSTFGEPLAGLEVVALQGATVVGRGTTDSDGNWTLEGVPAAPCVIRVRGERLLGPSDAVEVSPREGQQRVRVRDVLVEVRRTFRVAGSIDVATETLEVYRDELRERTGGALDLEGDALLAAYLRTLRLEQRNLGASSGRVVPIASDGTFAWSCALPAEDVEFVLQSRDARATSRGQVTRVRITPAGDRALDVELAFPPSAVQSDELGARDGDAQSLGTAQSLPANL